MPQNNNPRDLTKKLCLGTGFVALDIVRSINGRSTEQRYAGGSCGNVLTILAYLGWRTAPIARIGDDQPGMELVKDLKRWSVDTHFLVQETSAKTPVYFQEITFDKRGTARHQFSRVCLSCGARTAGYRPVLQRNLKTLIATIPPASVFYFDRVAKANLEIASRAKERGAFIVFEPSGVKDKELFAACLRLCHVFKYSKERLSGVSDAAGNAKVPVEIETHGSDGLFVKVRQESMVVHEEQLPAVPAPKLCDAAGSGDWCTAGLIHALLSGRQRFPNFVRSRKALVRALRWGQALAALNCCYEGARGLMYNIPREKTISVLTDLLKGKDVITKVETATSNYEQRSKHLGTCVVCNRKLKE